MDDPPGSPEPANPSSGPAAAPETMSAEPAGTGGSTEPAGSGGGAEPAGSGGGADPPPAGAGTAWWPLRRSIRNRKLKGVAGGVAAAADQDPTLVRLLFVVAGFSGWGIVAYVVLAVVLQDETVEEPARPLARDPRRNLRIGLGIAAVVAFGRLFDGWFFGRGDMGVPFLLIAVGAAVLWARRDQSPSPLAPPPVPETAPPRVAPPDGVPWAAMPAAPLGAGIGWRSTGRDLLRLAAAFVAVGALLALVAGTFLVVAGAVPMRLPFLPAAVAVAGVLGLLVSVARRGRVIGLLLPGGVLLAAAALAVGLASFPGSAGHRVVAIGPGTPLLPRYEHSAGRLVLDLRHLELQPGDDRRVVAKVGAGQLMVIVPAAVATDVTAEVGAGNATLFGQEESGPALDVSARAGTPAGGHLVLELAVGVGQVTVELAPEETFDVSCQVPAEAEFGGTGPVAVTCPHPQDLARRPMSCSVALVDPEGGTAGKAFCRAAGFGAVPKVGTFGVSCEVPADTAQATCAPLDAAQLKQLAARRAAVAPAAGPAAAPPNPSPAAGVQLVCGDADPTGVRVCTTTPASVTSTTAAVSYLCKDDPVTKAPTGCVPG